MITSFREIMELAKKLKSQKIAVVAPEDDASIEAIKHAIEEDIVEAILVGEKAKIEPVMKKFSMGFEKVEIVDVQGYQNAAYKSVEMVKNKEAALLMKGKLHTDELLHVVLDKQVGLRTGALLSHAFVMHSPRYHKLFTFTDCAMVVAPDLDQKMQIIQNAVNLAQKVFEIPQPKVAVLAAVETVNVKMPATADAAGLAKMSQRGQIKDAIVDGPLAFDNAISDESAKLKGITSHVAGDPDIMLMPDIEAGNIAYKALTYLSDCDSAGIILGAKAPIVLTSRADTMQCKLNSISLCALASMRL